MISLTTADFWESYYRLPDPIREKARKAYRLWLQDPAHPGLNFKKVGNVWSVRIDKAHRALGIIESSSINWFWIGKHDEYERKI